MVVDGKNENVNTEILEKICTAHGDLVDDNQVNFVKSLPDLRVDGNLGRFKNANTSRLESLMDGGTTNVEGCNASRSTDKIREAVQGTPFLDAVDDIRFPRATLPGQEQISSRGNTLKGFLL